jgi:Citrate synthase, C-terminal domain
VIATGISTVRHGRLIYRGKDAAAYAATTTLEETAALLWQSAEPVAFPKAAIDVADPFRALAALVATSHPMLGRSIACLHQDAAVAIGHLAASFGIDGEPEPLHWRIGTRWRLSAARAERVRQALVLVADHELNASAFATRVAASTGASVAASWPGSAHCQDRATAARAPHCWRCSTRRDGPAPRRRSRRGLPAASNCPVLVTRSILKATCVQPRC